MPVGGYPNALRIPTTSEGAPACGLDAVEVNEIVGTQSYTLEPKVDADDIGKVIGKRGRISEVIRISMRAASTKEGRRANIQIIETGQSEATFG